MESFKLETRSEDVENKTAMYFESPQFKREFPDLKDFVKSETNQTVKDKTIDLSTENNQNSRNLNRSKISCHNKIPVSFFKSEPSENSLAKISRTFSGHPEGFDKHKGDGSSFRNHSEPFKFCVETFSDTTYSKSQHSKVHINVRHKHEIADKENAWKGHLTIRTEAVEKQIKYVCDHCRRGFFRMGNLKGHLSTHIDSKKNIITFLSKHCDEYSSNERMDLNICTEQNTIKQQKFEVQNNKFTHKNNLRNHSDTALHKIKQYKCSLCSYECSRQNSLKIHIDSVHNKIKQHKCGWCPYQCAQKTNLKNHIDGMHNKIKHKCGLCSNKYSQKQSLKKHIDNVHNKIKQHKCGLCSYETAHRQRLKIHIDVVHNNIKQKCELCPYESVDKHSLKIHIDAVHNKIKQNKCELCPYTSAYKQNLRKHISAVHKKSFLIISSSK